MKFKLWVTGDPIEDVWYIGDKKADRIEIDECITKPGGAANTFVNALHLAKGSEISVASGWSDAAKIHKLIRLRDKNREVEFWDYKQNELHKMYRFLYPFRNIHFDPYHNVPQGLVISEYNKGGANYHQAANLQGRPEYKFIIVDSRYRSFRLDWLDLFPLKIWHATGTEWDYTWAQNFDYTIFTDGPNPIKVYEKGSGNPWELAVPDTKVTDTIGAGDTLTAAVGVFLANECAEGRQLNIETVLYASRFAVSVCQEVIQEAGTAIPQTTLLDYLRGKQIVH